MFSTYINILITYRVNHMAYYSEAGSSLQTFIVVINVNVLALEHNLEFQVLLWLSVTFER